MNIQNVKRTLNRIGQNYDRIAESVGIRSKCQWYEEDENSTKFFLNLEKKNDPLKHW